MTYEEAIRYAKELLKDGGNIKKQEFVKLVVNALEKQIPKKPNNIGFIDVIKAGTCPICSEGCNYTMKHCVNCGQALDWSEEE